MISGFENITTGVSHLHLEKRHVLEFTGSKETYQSPGKKARHDMVAAAKQGLRSRWKCPARSEHLTLPNRPGSSSSSPGSGRSTRTKMPGVGTWTPVSKICQPISQSWSTSGRGSSSSSPAPGGRMETRWTGSETEAGGDGGAEEDAPAGCLAHSAGDQEHREQDC